MVVYNNNIENLHPKKCSKFDSDKLFNYIKKQSTSPDIYIVQQISNQAQLKTLTTRMSAELPGTYAGVIAIAEPKKLKHDTKNDCAKLKAQQTNAVIYRTERLTRKADLRWRSDAPDGQNIRKGCRNLDKDNGNSKLNGGNQDRVENIAVRLSDKVAKKDVTVASFHWPTSGPWRGPYCAEENIREAQDRTAALGGDLTILGGDANSRVDSKSSEPWWQNAIDGGFYDVIGQTCGASCPTSANTFEERRIDYLLVKGGRRFTEATTISTTATAASTPTTSHSGSTSNTDKVDR